MLPSPRRGGRKSAALRGLPNDPTSCGLDVDGVDTDLALGEGVGECRLLSIDHPVRACAVADDGRCAWCDDRARGVAA